MRWITTFWIQPLLGEKKKSREDITFRVGKSSKKIWSTSLRMRTQIKSGQIKGHKLSNMVSQKVPLLVLGVLNYASLEVIKW